MTKYDLWLASLQPVSSLKKIQVCNLFGDAEGFYRQKPDVIDGMHLFTELEFQIICQAQKETDPNQLEDVLKKSGVSGTTIQSADYPMKLRQIYKPPFALFYRGNLPGRTPCAAIVGARMCSEYGRTISNQLGKKLAASGIAVVSGMALGVDSASHAGALEADGETYAVLGCGCDICYPKSARSLYDQIPKKGGILSEYFPGTDPLARHFPERNRIISGLSDVVVIVEAKERSGSLITADFALEQGKDIYAVPGRLGDSLSAGCNRLIAQGAGILHDMEDFLKTLGVIEKKTESTVKFNKDTLEKEELLVYSCLDLHPKFINQIIEETGMHLLNVMHAAESLKRKQLIRESFQNYYCRSF